MVYFETLPALLSHYSEWGFKQKDFEYMSLNAFFDYRIMCKAKGVITYQSYSGKLYRRVVTEKTVKNKTVFTTVDESQCSFLNHPVAHSKSGSGTYAIGFLCRDLRLMDNIDNPKKYQMLVLCGDGSFCYCERYKTDAFSESEPARKCVNEVICNFEEEDYIESLKKFFTERGAKNFAQNITNATLHASGVPRPLASHVTILKFALSM